VTAGDIPAVNRRLKTAFLAQRAPIMDLVAAQTRDPFRILVGTILSARTKDACTADACERLFARATTPGELERLPVAELERLIYPVGFYRTKARMLKRLPGVLRQRFGGRLPQTVEELCELPGVGRKTANVVLGNCFGLPAMVVDTHVLRVADRLGLARGRDADQVEAILCSLLPPGRWTAFCHRVTWFGRERCVARRPRCEECRLASLCPFLQADRQGT